MPDSVIDRGDATRRFRTPCASTAGLLGGSDVAGFRKAVAVRNAGS